MLNSHMRQWDIRPIQLKGLMLLVWRNIILKHVKVTIKGQVTISFIKGKVIMRLRNRPLS